MPGRQLPLQRRAPQRPVADQPGRLGDDGGDVRPAEPLAPRRRREGAVEDRLQQRAERQRVGGSDRVDRRAHQLRADHLPRGHQPVQLRRVVSVQPVPQREMRHERHLALQSDEMLEHVSTGSADAFEQQLPGERGPAQRPAREHGGQSWMPRVSAPSTTRLVPLTRRPGLARKTTGAAISSRRAHVPGRVEPDRGLEQIGVAGLDAGPDTALEVGVAGRDGVGADALARPAGGRAR